MKNTIVLLIVFVVTLNNLTVSAQESIEKTIQIKDEHKNAEYSLFFVDFWATWCVPCVYAKEHLTVLQNQNQNKFLVVSISNESPQKVEKHLTKHATELVVAIDFDNSMFNKYNIKSLPFGVLLNANGEVLWEGNPTSFKQSDLNRYIKTNTSKAYYHELFKETAVSTDNIITNYEPKANFEIYKLQNQSQGFQLVTKQDYFFVEGSLREILAYTLEVNSSQIQLNNLDNSYYRLYAKSKTKNSQLLKLLLKHLHLSKSEATVEGEVLTLNFDKAILWDTNQIDWGIDAPDFLVGDNQIQANNVTTQAIISKLSKVLEMPVISNLDKEQIDLHDWQLHYKYFNLMKMELEDSYGIIAEKKLGKYIKYIIKKDS